MAIKWWLGLDTSGRSMCPFCSDTVLDPLGHHAVTCRHGGDVVIRHNRLQDDIFDLCRHAHLSVRLEKGNGLTRDLDHTRPADILIARSDRGKPAALDITITSFLCPAILDESCQQAAWCSSPCSRDLETTLKWTQMPGVRLVLHFIGSGDIWKLGQRSPGYRLQAGVSLGHSPVIPQVISGG